MFRLALFSRRVFNNGRDSLNVFILHLCWAVFGGALAKAYLNLA